MSLVQKSDLPLARRMRVNFGAYLARFIRPRRPLAQGARRSTPGRLALTTGAVLVMLAVISVLFDSIAVTEARKLPRGVIEFFNWLTDFGKSGWVLWPVGVVLVLLIPLSAMLPRVQALVLSALAVRLTFVFTAIAIPGLVTNLVKGIIGRQRPPWTGEPHPYVFQPFDWQAKFASLPSGHSTAVLSIVVAIGTLFPRARPFLWLYALSIMVSRVIINAHHPSDVLAGALVGGIGALLVRNYFASRGFGFSIAADGHVQVHSGPSLSRVKAIARSLARS